MKNKLTITNVIRTYGYIIVTCGEAGPDGRVDRGTVTVERLAVDPLASREDQDTDADAQLAAIAAERGLDY